jgi:twitching motility two-component system response regulator PilG
MTTATLSHGNTAIPAYFLRNLIRRQATGKLTIQSPLDEFVTWQVYLSNGKINFANSSVGAIERLSYLLGNYLQKGQITLPQQLADDYSYICDLWKQGTFSFSQTRAILAQFTQEALVQVLSLPKSNCSFDRDGSLKNLFLNLSLDRVVAPIQNKIRHWWEIHSDISSPFQRPLIEDWETLKATFIEKQQLGSQWVEKFGQGLKNLSCLYEIAAKTQTSTLELALMLRPEIKKGEIKMLSYQDIQIHNHPSVVCVNNNPTTQKMLKFSLDSRGIKTHCIQDPFKALATVMGQKPNLIFIDTDIEEMNSYELCRLLRTSPGTKNIPVILLTKSRGITERIQGKLAKASGYLDKPFFPQELLKVVDSHLVSVAA